MVRIVVLLRLQYNNSRTGKDEKPVTASNAESILAHAKLPNIFSSAISALNTNHHTQTSTSNETNRDNHTSKGMTPKIGPDPFEDATEAQRQFSVSLISIGVSFGGSNKSRIFDGGARFYID
jgi:hypothetical protein